MPAPILPVLEYRAPEEAEARPRYRWLFFWLTLPAVLIPFVPFVQPVTPLSLAIHDLLLSKNLSFSWNPLGRGLLGALFFLWPLWSVWRLRLALSRASARAERIAIYGAAGASGTTVAVLFILAQTSFGYRQTEFVVVAAGITLSAIALVAFFLLLMRRASPETLCTVALMVPLLGHAAFAVGAGWIEHPWIGCFLTLFVGMVVVVEMGLFVARSFMQKPAMR